MSLLQLVSSDGQMVIANRQVPTSRAGLQTLQVLIRTWSPYDTIAHSLEELIGQGDCEEMLSDIKIRLKNVESILQQSHDINRLAIMSIELVGQTYEIEVLLEYNDNSIESGKVYA